MCTDGLVQLGEITRNILADVRVIPTDGNVYSFEAAYERRRRNRMRDDHAAALNGNEQLGQKFHTGCNSPSHDGQFG